MANEYEQFLKQKHQQLSAPAATGNNITAAAPGQAMQNVAPGVSKLDYVNGNAGAAGTGAAGAAGTAGTAGAAGTGGASSAAPKPSYSMWNYDINGDALYQQAAERYKQMGRQAMMDTMGQAATLTGGYGNTYAQNAGQQAYNSYLQGLYDNIPEYAQNAYSMWKDNASAAQSQIEYLMSMGLDVPDELWNATGWSSAYIDAMKNKNKGAGGGDFGVYSAITPVGSGSKPKVSGASGNVNLSTEAKKIANQYGFDAATNYLNAQLGSTTPTDRIGSAIAANNSPNAASPMEVMNNFNRKYGIY